MPTTHKHRPVHTSRREETMPLYAEHDGAPRDLLRVSFVSYCQCGATRTVTSGARPVGSVGPWITPTEAR